MEYSPTLHLIAFTDRVRVMNQTRQHELKLSANEANNLHADITTMLAEIARLNLALQDNLAKPIEVEIQGGAFK